MKKTILIADDEERIVSLISDFCENAGFSVVKAYDGEQALSIFSESNPDLCIIDIMMPEMDGWQLTREIRKVSNVPIIMLSARSEEFDMLEGFDAGIDEYVTKPFSPAVLIKRITALLNRENNENVSSKDKGLFIDAAAYVAKIDGVALNLTSKEFELLNYLYENKGRVISREGLLNSVWGYNYDGEERTVDSHIARLRIKLKNYGTHLKTVYGFGYKFEA